MTNHKNLVESIPIGRKQGDALRFVEFGIAFNRFYWLTGPSGPRGGHAHKKLTQVFVCLQQSVDISLSDGCVAQEITLNEGEAVIVRPGLWRDIAPLTEGAMLGVLASEHYSEEDYIRDFDEFVAWSSKK